MRPGWAPVTFAFHGSDEIGSALLGKIAKQTAHGSRRTEVDRERAVTRLLQDPKWNQRSDRWVGEHARVDDEYVKKIRKQLEKQAELERFRKDKHSTAGHRHLNSQTTGIARDRRRGRDGKWRKAKKPSDNGAAPRGLMIPHPVREHHEGTGGDGSGWKKKDSTTSR